MWGNMSKYNEILECVYRNKDNKSLEKNNPYYISDNPLLNNYEYVYNNVEFIFINHRYSYKINQNYEQYLTFFNCLINKYDIEDDYNSYLRKEIYLYNLNSIWKMFATRLLEFIGSAPKDILYKLLNNRSIINYFIRYNQVYNNELLTNLGITGYNYILENKAICNHYLNSPNDIFNIKIKNTILPKIPNYIIESKKVIREISCNANIEEFYYRYNWICNNYGSYNYMEEHKKFLDREIINCKSGIFKCIHKQYLNDSKIITDNNDTGDIFKQIKHRIFFKNNTSMLPKKYTYQEISKYVCISMFISRFFEASPYNILLDIEVLYEFAKENNISLKGMEIYEFLMNYEDKTIFDAINFYKHFLNDNIDIKSIFYDDWNNQRYQFINDLNNNILSLSGKEMYYDITHNDNLVLVHNTSIPVDKINKVIDIYNDLINGKKEYICLSLQDKDHQIGFGKKDNGERTIKFLFNKLDANRVGIIYHRDASTISATRVSDFSEYRSRLYTLNDFMNETYNYNEICYLTRGICFKPFGILVDDYITEEEKKLSELLNLKIVYRNRYVSSRKDYKEKIYRKKYNSDYNNIKLF